MRIDKFLKNSRLIKRRSVAKSACDSGRIFINDKQTKAGSEVTEGDEILIKFGEKEIKVRVINLIESQRKEDAANMYEVIE